jgi:hypothetical protein
LNKPRFCDSKFKNKVAQKSLVLIKIYLEDGLCELDVFAEALFLEIADGELVGEGQEVEDSVADVVVLKSNQNRQNRFNLKSNDL